MVEFLSKVLGKVVAFFANIRIYWCGIILFGDSHYKIKGPHMRQIIDALEPGDILMRRYDHYLGAIGIPGYWAHSAVYVGDNHIIHMIGAGIAREDILTFLRCDDIMILRPKGSANKELAVTKAYDMLASEIAYDYLFDAGDNKKMYCTELTDFVYDYPVKAEIGRDLITPDDTAHSKFFIKVWEKK